MSELLKFDDSIEHYEDVANEVAGKFLKSEWHKAVPPSGPRGEPPDTPGYSGYWTHEFPGDIEVTLTVDREDMQVVFDAYDTIRAGLFYQHDDGDELKFCVDEVTIEIDTSGEHILLMTFKIVDIDNWRVKHD